MFQAIGQSRGVVIMPPPLLRHSTKGLDTGLALERGIFSHLGFPDSLVGKESTFNAGDPSLIHWRRDRLPTPVFWPREFHGLYSPRGRKELDTTEQFSLSLHLKMKQQPEDSPWNTIGISGYETLE